MRRTWSGGLSSIIYYLEAKDTEYVSFVDVTKFKP